MHRLASYRDGDLIWQQPLPTRHGSDWRYDGQEHRRDERIDAGAPFPRHHTADLDAPGLEVDHEQHEIANDSRQREHLDREEVHRGDRTQVRAEEVFHGMRLPRAGAGSRPCRRRTRLSVLRPMWWPRLSGAPTSRVYPQVGFSVAIRTTSCSMSVATVGQPPSTRPETARQRCPL